MTEALAEKIIVALVTFVLTTVVGGVLAWMFKRSFWERETRLELFRKRYDEGTKLLESLSLLIGLRFYALQRLFWAIRDSQEEKVPGLERAYFTVVAKWNARFWLYRNKIRLLVSNDQAELFLDYRDDRRPNDPYSLHYCFVRAHRALLAAKDDRGKLPGAEQAVTALNHQCSKFLENLTTEFLGRATSLELLEMPKPAPMKSSDLSESSQG